MSEKREQAIYDAVHEQVMRLRIELNGLGIPDRIDAKIAQAGHAAGMAAIAAYRKPLRKSAPPARSQEQP